MNLRHLAHRLVRPLGVLIDHAFVNWYLKQHGRGPLTSEEWDRLRPVADQVVYEELVLPKGEAFMPRLLDEAGIPAPNGGRWSEP